MLYTLQVWTPFFFTTPPPGAVFTDCAQHCRFTGRRAAAYFDGETRTADYGAIIRENQAAFQAGTAFPDTFYNPLCYSKHCIAVVVLRKISARGSHKIVLSILSQQTVLRYLDSIYYVTW